MDVEGFEIPALLGAKRHIREDFPKLAICTYHIVSDMWEIPRMIDTIRPGYRFFLRLKSMANYIKKEAADTDCLLLYGCYPFYEPLADIYKQITPDGKIALDANSHWMDRIQRDTENLCRFMRQCESPLPKIQILPL